MNSAPTLNPFSSLVSSCVLIQAFKYTFETYRNMIKSSNQPCFFINNPHAVNCGRVSLKLSITSGLLTSVVSLQSHPGSSWYKKRKHSWV